MGKGGARPGTGPKPKPAEQVKRVGGHKMTGWVLDAIRELSERTGRSQSELIEEAVIHHHGLKAPNAKAVPPQAARDDL